MTTSKTYCKYPFREIAIKDFHKDRLRTFWPCCMMGNKLRPEDNLNKLEISNAHLMTPQEMYDHPRMQLLRHNLSNGYRDKACEVCWDQEDRGIKSFRSFSNHNYGYEEEGLSVIDIVASNICNLRCRMCGPMSSHQLMADYQYFKKNNLIDRVKKSTLAWSDESVPKEVTSSIQWDWLMENTDKIKVIKASGGEPFYDNKVIKLLNRYIETGNAKNTILMFHTNATQFNDEVVNIINQFRKNKHSFSVDGTDKVYEYIRYPATFDELNTSILNYIKNVSNYDPIMNFTMVLSAHNVLNASNYIEWIRSLSDRASINFAEIYPIERGISLSHLPVYILKEAKSRVEKYLIFKNSIVDDKIVNLVKHIENAIKNNKENRKLVVEETTLFDLSRNQNYKDFLDPMLVEWMNNE